MTNIQRSPTNKPIPSQGIQALLRTASGIHLVVIVSFILLITSQASLSYEEIKIPFNFSWGESSSRLEAGLKSVKARIIERKQVRGRLCLVVEGIPQRLLQRALFYFDNDALGEIELHYGDSQWDQAKYDTFFEKTRLNIERKYGPGRIIARQRSVDSGVLQSLVGYQWTQPVTALALFYYSAKKETNSFSLLSLHYRGF